MQRSPLENIPNFLTLSETVGTGGQPAADQFPLLKEAGYEVVINLALADSANALPEEAEIAARNGLDYVHIPVVWTDPHVEEATRFFQAMDANAGRKVFAHCIANKRVSTLMYLYRVLRQGMNPEDAADDMHRIWNPSPVWQKFIDEVLTEKKLQP